MSSFRSSATAISKFRNVYCDSPRAEECWTGLQLSEVTGEQNYIKASAKYFAVSTKGGGGPFAVFDINAPCRFDINQPKFNGHTGPVLDFEWNPFNENQIASISEDCTVKLWTVPEGGLKESSNTPTSEIGRHDRKGLLCRWNPTANGVLASAGYEHTVRLWDVTTSKEMANLEGHSQAILDLAWDFIGSTYATTSRDKHVRIIDARSNQVVDMIEEAHDGNKSSKLTYCGLLDKLCTVGFQKGSSKRHFKLWDPRNTTAPLETKELDQAAGVVMPFFDVDTNMIYFAGKGEGSVKYYEVGSTNPYILDCSMYRSNNGAKGACMIPKRACDTSHNESMRMLKLTTNSVEPLKFYIPRKGSEFQTELFPDAFAGVPSHSAQEWFSGSNKAPMVVSLDPSSRDKAPHEMDSERMAEASTKDGASMKAYVAPKSAPELQKELDRANAKIAELEAKLKLHNIS